MKIFTSIGKIRQFKDVIREISHASRFDGVDDKGKVIYNDNPLPTLTFKGTVKLHGTNAGITYYNGKIYAQKRSSLVEKTHMGFLEYVNAHKEEFLKLFVDTFTNLESDTSYTLFGEWVGPGIQKGVGISQIKEKSFFVFYTCVRKSNEETKQWGNTNNLPEINISRCYNINMFPTFSIDIDFNYPKNSVNTLVDITNKVENQCPVALHFGINGIGEGVVWTGKFKNKTYRFKVKGAKHSETKTKNLAPINPEKLESISKVVEYLVTTKRLEHALQEVKAELDKRYTGDILRWIANDIISEESDTLVINGLEWKDVARNVSDRYRKLFFNKIDLK